MKALSAAIRCASCLELLAGSADGDRLAAELRIISLFDGCVECVHVDVDDRRPGQR
jgi:hypothetical protein